MNKALFYMFFKIGLFTLGGGPAMIPLVQKELVDDRKLISGSDFLDLVAFASGLPGAIIVNLSIFIGNRLNGVKGALVSAAGAVLPAYLSMIALATVFTSISNSKLVQAAFLGIRPTIIVLIATSVYNIARYSEYDRQGKCFALFALLALLVLDISAVLVIISAGFVGAVFYGWKGLKNAD